jgi:predicted acylesterase/phospholipase RssA
VRQQGLKADILLKPPVQKFGMMEVKSFEKIVDAGYQHALDELKQWLEKLSFPSQSNR